MDERDGTRAELEHLRRRLAEISRMMLSPSAAASTGMGGGIEPRDVHRLNAGIRHAQDVAGITRRIAALEAELELPADD